ncbi:hypothetical protein BRADI_4g43047v3 [Brachypodium distachyon]|uniref:1-phosphatidylinositol-4-phosphate 5-kinase n=1 Tax=Brachypodium distachyon TaxID=15368 RepID=A0A2K2CTW2_BRADI|nr:hypothetical protein BRADI_4g43047v3 [Brachypodium distachyon]
MDYSLLVGLHLKNRCKDMFRHECLLQILAIVKILNRIASEKPGIYMHSKLENIVENPEITFLLIGEPTGKFQDVILFFGIIDFLQDYDIIKKLEHAYKSMQYDPNSTSSVKPKQYCKWFRDFIYRAFRVREDVQ